jgi:hypothetical protein
MLRADLTFVRGRFRESYGTPIGTIFDLLGGLESTAAPPTEAGRRALTFAEADIAEGIARLHEVVTAKLPQLAAMLAQPSTPR